MVLYKIGPVSLIISANRAYGWMHTLAKIDSKYVQIPRHWQKYNDCLGGTHLISRMYY